MNIFHPYKPLDHDSVLIMFHNMWHMLGPDRAYNIHVGQAIWDAYESGLQSLARWTDGPLSQAGFRNLKYKNCNVILRTAEWPLQVWPYYCCFEAINHD